MAVHNSTAVDEALCLRARLETPHFVEKLLPQLVELVRYSKLLPQGEEHAIRRGSRDFLASSKHLGDRSLGAVHQILSYSAQSLHQATKPEDLKNFNLLVDSLDDVLEKVDAHLRDAKAGKQREELVEEEDSAPTPSTGSTSTRAPKPQVRWRQLVDNQRTSFVPRLLVKHNEQTPLSPRLLEAQCKAGIRPFSGVALPTRHGDASEDTLVNPYEEELSSLSWPDNFFRPRPACRYRRMEDTPLIMVRTEADLREMVEEIKATCIGSEIAVDVEHHDFRSFRGFVCLVQVSTRQKDFLIDPFDIFEQAHMLNEVFSDPRILKVLHGADRDVMWLQRDFSVYLVNMFDTGLATRALRMQGGYSLANLVSHFCGVKLDKKYQTADWRERPLSEEMIHYARADTHYLLFCYDCLKNALLAQNAQHGLAKSGVNLGIAALEGGDFEVTDEGVQSLQTVMQQSTALCSKTYREAPLDAGEYAASLCERYGSRRPLEAKQMGALKALIEWRDQLARNIDESLNFVAPDACLWRVCLAMPTTPVKLRSTCNPLPATLQQHAQEVVDIVVKCSKPGPAMGTQHAEAPKECPVPSTASASPPEPLPSPPDSEATLDPEASPSESKAHGEWPVRLAQSPRPLVHVSASFGYQGSEPSRKRKFAVLCAGCDSASEEPAATGDGGTAERPQKKRARVIRRKISFASPAPPAAVVATKPPEPVQGETPGNLEPDPALPTHSTPDAPAPLRKRKKRRKRADALEQVVEMQAAKSASLQAEMPASNGAAKVVPAETPASSTASASRKQALAKAAPVVAAIPAEVPGACKVPPAPPAAAHAAPPSENLEMPQASVPRPKKKKKLVKRMQDTVVDPYL